MKSVEELIADLASPKKVSDVAKRELTNNISDEDLALLAKQSKLCHKGCWSDAAEVLKDIGYPRIKPVLPYLMEWFQDINWPGVRTIVEIFRGISTVELLPYIEDASKRSITEKDDLWAFGFVHLIKELELEHLVDNELYKQRASFN